MRSLSILLLAVAGLCWGCTTDGLHEDLATYETDVEARGKKPVPFKGTMSLTGAGQLGEEGRCAENNPLFTTILLQGEGRLTHMGRTRVEVSHCVDQTGTVMSPLAILDGRAILTAANGDEVHSFTANGGLIPTDSPLVFALDMPFVIDGGTGRFAEAEGEGRITGKVVFTNFPPQPGDPPARITNHYDGVIVF